MEEKFLFQIIIVNDTIFSFVINLKFTKSLLFASSGIILDWFTRARMSHLNFSLTQILKNENTDSTLKAIVKHTRDTEREKHFLNI